jgi:hypothetical protein
VVGDHSLAEVLAVTQAAPGPIPRWLRTAGGVGGTPPGETRSSTQALPEGRYYVIGSSGEGRPATASLEVEGGDPSGELPETGARIVAREYAFTATGLAAGRNRIVFENAGAEPHHVVAARLRPGKGLAEVRNFIRRESGPPPADFASAVTTAVLDGRTRQVTELDLKRGRYALLCFVQDRKGGPPHIARGMAAVAAVD